MKNSPKYIHFTPKVKVHFMGIGGSGISAVSLMAQKKGFIVSGCDLERETAYLGKVKESIKKIYKGHSVNHLENVDLVVVSPSVLFQSKSHPEYRKASYEKRLITWQKFLSKYLHQGKKVVCIAGTHGKSTTTAMSALVFQEAGYDPSAIVGAEVNQWGENYAIGEGKFFITEADEFFDNFLNYTPETCVLTNVEYDHPDYFKSEREMHVSYAGFIKRLTGDKNLIVNMDSLGIKKILKILGARFLKSLNLYGYTLDKPKINKFVSYEIKVRNCLFAKILKKERNATYFYVHSQDLNLRQEFKLKIPGDFNVANSLATVILAKLYGIEERIIEKGLWKYSGIGRRLEMIGEKRGVRVYDDYAHHPTAIRETIKAVKQKYPKSPIWAVVEPHSYSRTKALLKDYKNLFDAAEHVVIAPIFRARDKKTLGVSGQSIVDVSNHKDIFFIDDFRMIVSHLGRRVKEGEIVLVMGAGKSYVLARQILKQI